MQKTIIFIFFFILLILQITVVPRISIFNVFPNIVLAAVLVIAAVKNDNSGFFAAIAAALILDFFSSRPFGVYLLSFIITVWLAQSLGRNIFKSTDFSGQFPLFLCASLVYSFLYLFLNKIFQWLGMGASISFWSDFLRTGLLEAGENAIVSLIFLILYKKIHGLFVRI